MEIFGGMFLERLYLSQYHKDNIRQVSRKYIGSECKALADGGKVLLLLGGGSAKKSGLYDKVVASLNESGVEFTELWGVQPNPRIDKVREAAMTAKRENVSLILAVGGGSVIDTAKAAAAGALYDGDPWDFYSGAAKPVKALPLGVVLTIPAAGSESSMASVISNPETNEKIGCSAECYLPRFAVMNPENTLHSSPLPDCLRCVRYAGASYGKIFRQRQVLRPYRQAH